MLFYCIKLISSIHLIKICLVLVLAVVDQHIIKLYLFNCLFSTKHKLHAHHIPWYPRYVPAVVDHSDDMPCSGTYMLHQGIQRRLAITITHEQGPDFFWKDVKELVVGRHLCHCLFDCTPFLTLIMSYFFALKEFFQEREYIHTLIKAIIEEYLLGIHFSLFQFSQQNHECMKTNPDVCIAGRIRTTPDFRDYDTEHTVLSLGLFPACYIQQPSDDRVFFRFEAAWDSSLHNSPLLNRVTASGERIYLTLSAYLEVGSLWHFTYKK